MGPYRAGQVDVAADLISSGRYERQLAGARDGVIWLLEQGKILQDAGRFAASDAAFARADERMRAFDLQAEISVTGEIGGVLTTQELRSYRGRGWEKILLETYRALNQLALGELEQALVFCRRAFVRQAEAVEAHGREIERSRSAARDNGIDPGEVMGQAEVRAQLAAVETRVNPAYADYANPLASWLVALLAWIDGDATGAAVDMRKAAAMAPENGYVAELLDEIERGEPPGGESGRVYVVLENGLAPMRVEEGIGIITRNGYSALVLPALVFHPPQAAALSLGGEGGRERTVLLADVSAIVATDFKGQFPGIVLRTLASVVLKEVATKQVREEHEGLGFVLGSIWKAATSGADIRTWQTPGAEFQVAHCARPPDGLLVVSLIDSWGGRHLRREVALPPAPVVLVLARSVGLTSLEIHVIPIGPVTPEA